MTAGAMTSRTEPAGGEEGGGRAERRLRILHELSAPAAKPRTIEEACRLAASVLLGQLDEIPFALFYRLEENGRWARLLETVGDPPSSPSSPDRVELSADSGGSWPLAAAIGTGRPQQVESALVLLLTTMPSEDKPEAVLVVGARTPLDEGTRAFLELAAAQVAHSVARASAFALGEAARRQEAGRAEAEAANRAKDEFIAMISHELRTPLGAILIWTQLLRNERLDEEATLRALGMIERSTKTLAKLIDDLLDVSRIIAGKLQVEARPVDLMPVVENALEAEKMTAESKRIRIDFVVESAPVQVMGDAGRLQQVLDNLLSNALKFTPEGGRVEVRLGLRGSHARILVSDTGAGISPDFLPYIFERFRQADSTSTRISAV